MQKNYKLSIIIPCYNEEQNLPLIISRIKSLMNLNKDIEVLFVNNGSTDNSKMIFKAEVKKANITNFKVVNVIKNKGYGYGIFAGLNKATGNVLAWTHADMQTDPTDVTKAFDIYKRQAKGEKIIVKGKRKNRGILDVFFTFCMQTFANILLKTRLSDINAQPKLFDREFFEKFIIKDIPNDFSLDLYLLNQAYKHHYRIISFPVLFSKRYYGQAKGGGSWKTKIKLIYRTLSYIIAMYKKLKVVDK